MKQEILCDRTDWAPGPWDTEPDRVEWIYQGTPCLAIRNRFGTWCGYAGIRPDHPLYGVPFDVLRSRVQVHGDLTYSSKCQGHVCHTPPPGDTDDIWWLGFDCGHAFDRAPGLEALMRRLGTEHEPFGSYKDLEYVKQETQDLADQLQCETMSSKNS